MIHHKPRICEFTMLTVFSTGFVAFCMSETCADTLLYGVTGSGSVIRIDKNDGSATLVGDSGFEANAMASDSLNRIFTAGASSADADKLIQINPITGAGSEFLEIDRPGGYGIRGIAFNSADELFAILSQADMTEEDLLATIDMATGDVTLVGGDGGTGLTDLQGLAFDAADDLFGVRVRGELVQIDTSTAAASIIGGSDIGPDDQALEFDQDGTLYAARENLKTIDALGNATLVGPLGASFDDVRGLAIIIPEPATLMLELIAIVGFGFVRGRRRVYQPN